MIERPKKAVIRIGVKSIGYNGIKNVEKEEFYFDDFSKDGIGNLERHKIDHLRAEITLFSDLVRQQLERLLRHSSLQFFKIKT